MSTAAARLAAIRARVKAKETDEKRKTEERIAVDLVKEKEADLKDKAKRREEVLDAMREAVKKRAAESPAKVSAPAAEDVGAPGAKRPRLSNGDAALPKCRCGLEAKRLTVKKEGPNFGRSFFKCPQEQDEKRCRFFEWSDATSPGPESVTTPPAADGAVPPQSQVLCKCGLPPRRQTVKKEGPNLGRDFLKCAEDKCAFFQWADSEPEQSPGGLPLTGGRPPPAPVAAGAALPSMSRQSLVLSTMEATNLSEAQKRCLCGSEAQLRTVRKEGPNFGRQFWCCVQGQECKSQKKFFEWADAPDAAPKARPQVVAGPATGEGSATGASAGTCFRCGGVGHFARDCSMAKAGIGGAVGAPPGAAAAGSVCFRCGQAGHFARDCIAQAQKAAGGEE